MSSRLSRRIALAATGLSLAVMLALGGSAYYMVSGLIQDNVESALKSKAEIQAEDVSGFLSALEFNLDNLARNTVVANALADSQGRAAYLEPFLQDYKAINGVPVQVAVTDYRGAPLGKSGGGAATKPLYDWLEGAISQGAHRAVIDEAAAGPILTLMAPVIYGNTGMPEGALVYRIGLRDISLRHHIDAGEMFLTYLDAGRRLKVVTTSQPLDDQDKFVAQATLSLPHPLDTLGFGILLSADRSHVAMPLRQLEMIFAAIGVVALVVVWLIAIYLGNRLTGPLARLTATASQVDVRHLAASDFAVTGDDEIARLGAAFGKMVQRLGQAYEDLEAQGQILLRNAERIAHLGSWAVDWQAERIQWSEEMYTILDLPRDTVPGWRPFLRRLPPQDRQLFRAAMKDARSGGKKLDLDIHIPTEAQGRRILHVQGLMVRGRSSDRPWFNGTLQDITEQKALEEKLGAVVEELKRSNVELEQFAYVASHDLRQPLRMVSSYMALLERKYGEALGADAREYIAFAKDGAQRMDELVQDLLQYSRVGRRETAFSPVDLGDVTALALDNLELALHEKGGQVTVAEPLPTVLGNAIELTRLMQNLVGNALKYTPEDRAPDIHVDISEGEKEWTVSVRDNGIGIAAEFQEKVFGIFQRLHASDQYEGTGIGLAICKKIVEAHQGHIWFESEVGTGTVFYFTLPKHNGQ